MTLIRFICVNYNNSDYTIKLCDSIANQINLNIDFSIECIIVDNSTSNNDSAVIREFSNTYPWITYAQPSGNLGYFGGLNYGLKSKETSKVDYIVICNNDLDFDCNFCRNIAGKKYHKNIYAVCPDVVTKDGFHQNPHVKNKINWSRRLQFDIYFSHYYLARSMSFLLKIFRPVKKSPPQLPAGCEIHMGIGACYLLTSEFLTRFSKLNYPHFLYGEEAYFSDQIHSSGGILWFDPDLIVHHAESATLSKIPKRTAYEFSKSGYPSYRKML